MSKLDRYVGVTVLVAMLAVLAIIFALDTLFGFMAQLDAMRANYQLLQVTQYMLLTAPRRLYEIIPVAALIGCLIGLGSLANHSELVVMRAAGVSLVRIGWTVMKPALVLVLLGLVLNEFVAPATEQMAQSIKRVGRSADGQFTDEGLWHREGNSYVYFNAVNQNGTLHGVNIYLFDDQHRIRESVYAEQAVNKDDQWLLANVKTSTYTENKVTSVAESSKEWETDLTPSLLRVVVAKPDDLSIRGLSTYIDYLKKQDLETGEYRLAFYKKLMQPVAIFALVLIGMSFVFGPLRSVSMGLRLFSGVITGVTFMILQNLVGPASIVFGFPPLLAVMLPILICFAIGIILLKRAG